MSEEVERVPDEDKPVTQGVFRLQMKVLEQRLTLKLIAGLVAAQALSHFSLPGDLTTPATFLIPVILLGKLFLGVRG
jgi:hypothetical protein